MKILRQELFAEKIEMLSLDLKYLLNTFATDDEFDDGDIDSQFVFTDDEVDQIQTLRIELKRFAHKLKYPNQ